MSEGAAISEYLLTCIYGLEQELAGEIGERLGCECEHGWCEVTFRKDLSASELRHVRIATNSYLVLDGFAVDHTKDSLAKVAERVAAMRMEEWQRRRQEFGSEWAGGPVRVCVNRSGKHNYSYREIEEAVLEVIPDSCGMKARLDGDGAELRIDVDGEQCRLLGRLSDRPMSQRPWKVRHTRAETDATLAAAMVRRTNPQPSDAVLDPFCGSGTIAIERALAARVERVVAGDSKEKYVEWTAVNAENAGVELCLNTWDARRLPFQDRAFTAVVTAPPAGRPEDGRPWGLAEYGRLLAELVRVVEFGGPAVVLARDQQLMKRAVKRVACARVTDRLLCDWRGIRHAIFTLRRTP